MAPRTMSLDRQPQPERAPDRLERPARNGREAGGPSAPSIDPVQPDLTGPEIARHVARAGELLAPVRAGLEQVEARLRATDSALFSPLSNAFLTLISSGGKRMRPALALLAAEVDPALPQPVADTPAYEQVIALAASVEMLHTSTLVHDDVIDGALLRRGAPTLNARWSGGSTVLAGNYMFGAAARLAAETGSMRVIHIFTDTLRVIVDGELRQLLDRFAYDQPKENYYHRIYAKTASLFCAATEGAAVLVGMDEAGVAALRDYGYNLGMAFQIVDDILDFTGDESTLGKPAGSDLAQGTLTLPFFYHLRDHAGPDGLVARIEDARNEAETQDDSALWRAAIAEVVRELRADGVGLAAAEREAHAFIEKARAALAPFPDTIYMRSLLGLCDFVVQRTF